MPTHLDPGRIQSVFPCSNNMPSILIHKFDDDGRNYTFELCPTGDAVCPGGSHGRHRIYSYVHTEVDGPPLDVVISELLIAEAARLRPANVVDVVDGPQGQRLDLPDPPPDIPSAPRSPSVDEEPPEPEAEP